MSKKQTWIRDLLIVPIIVGAVIAILTYVLPKIFSESRELSYQVEEPLAYLDQASLGAAQVKVNDYPVDAMYAGRIRLWNSGSLPLKNLPVLVEFKMEDPGAKILSVSHNTRPAREFGGISETESSAGSKRYVYALLNPGDEDDLVFLATAKADARVYAKSESLILKAVPPERPNQFTWYVAAIGAALATLLGEFAQASLRWIRRKFSRNEGAYHGN